MAQRKWSAAQDETLRTHWGKVTVRELAELVGRPLKSIYRRAYVLRLSSEFESVHHAAMRCGYHPAKLLNLLSIYGIEVRTSARGRPIRTVRRADVDAFVAKRRVKVEGKAA